MNKKLIKNINKVSIILVGDWNVKIFTPTWIMNELLSLKKNEELGIGFNTKLQPRFSYKDIELLPTERAFEIHTEKTDKKHLVILNDIVMRLISCLPFTPNLKVGFNYRFQRNFSHINLEIPELFDTFELKETKFVRDEDEFTLNMILGHLEPQSLLYNFHYGSVEHINDSTIKDNINYIVEHGIK